MSSLCLGFVAVNALTTYVRKKSQLKAHLHVKDWSNIHHCVTERLSDAGNCSEKVSKWTLSSAHFITRTDPNLMNELPYTVLYC